MASPAAKTQADIIKKDLTSPTACSSSTVSSLRNLLGYDARPTTAKAPTRAGKENKAEPIATARPRSRKTIPTKKAGTVEEPCVAQLNPKERYILATEIVNVTLKSLSSVSKPTPAAQERPSSRQSNNSSRSPTKTIRGTETSRSLSKLTGGRNPNGKQPNVSKLSASFKRLSITGDTNSGVAVIAECSRMGFAYLRSPEAEKLAGKDAGPLQLENGMLALIGKMIGQKLEKPAAKELLVLKARLEDKLSPVPSKTSRQKASQKKTTSLNNEEQPLEQLLRFSASVPDDLAVIQVLITYHILVLKLIALQKQPEAIEEASRLIQLSHSTSPVTLLTTFSEHPPYRAKAAQQFQLLAQALLGLCPSISSSFDTTATNNSLSPSPRTVFRLQVMGAACSTSGGRLNGKQKSQDELMDQFIKILKTLARRDVNAPRETFIIARQEFEWYCNKLGISPLSSPAVPILDLLAKLAMAAGDNDEADRYLSEILEISGDHPYQGLSKFGKALHQIKLATVTLKIILKSSDAPLSCLEGSLQGTVKSIKAANPNDEQPSTSRDPELKSFIWCTGDLVQHICRVFAEVWKRRQLLISEEAVKDMLSAVDLSLQFFVTHFGSMPDDMEMLQERSDRIGTVYKAAVEKDALRYFIKAAYLAMLQDSKFERAGDQILDNCYILLQRIRYVGDQLGQAGHMFSAGSGPRCNEQIILLSDTFYHLHHRLELRTSADGLNQRNTYGWKHLRQSMEILRDLNVPPENQHIQKFIRYASALEEDGVLEQAQQVYHDAIVQQISGGQMLAMSQHYESLPLQIIDGKARFETYFKDITSILTRFYRIIRKSNSTEYLNSHPPINWGREADSVVQIGFLFEWIVGFILENLTRKREHDETSMQCFNSFAKAAINSYSEDARFWVHQTRLFAILLRAESEIPGLLDEQTLRDIEQSSDSLIHHWPPSSRIPNDLSDPLKSNHHRAMLALARGFQNGAHPNSSEFTKALDLWEEFLRESERESLDIRHSVDDIELWISQLESICAYLDSQGSGLMFTIWANFLARLYHRLGQAYDPYRAIITSKMMVVELRRGSDGFLTLAEKSIAQLALHKLSNDLQQDQTPDDHFKVDAYVSIACATAEVLISQGLHEPARRLLERTEQHCKEDTLNALHWTNVPLSRRLRGYQLLAETCRINSVLALETGDGGQALEQAKKCVRLNNTIWTTIESKSLKKSASTGDIEQISHGTAPAKMPANLSKTQKGLQGAKMWPYVHQIFQGICQLSKVLAHQGNFEEALYQVKEAKRIAQSMSAEPFHVITSTLEATLHLRNNGLVAAEEAIEEARSAVEDAEPGLDIFRYRAVEAQIYTVRMELPQANAIWDEVLEDLHKFRKSRTATASGTEVESTLKELITTLDTTGTEIRNETALHPGRGKKAAVKAASKQTKKPVARSAAKSVTKSVITKKTTSRTESADHNSLLKALEGDILRRKAVIHLIEDEVSDALDLLNQADELGDSSDGFIQQKHVQFQAFLMQAVHELQTDMTFNGLLESTIAFPALAGSEEYFQIAQLATPSHASSIKSNNIKGGRGKKASSKANFMSLLNQARDCIVEIQTKAYQISSSSIVQQICGNLGRMNILLSSVTALGPAADTQSVTTAHLWELASNRLHESDMQAIETDKMLVAKQNLLQWPAAPKEPDFTMSEALARIQSEYIDIIPETWSAISMQLNDARDELYIIRYKARELPFVLRLPMARHQFRDQDEEVFGFDEGKIELQDIIELSNQSTKVNSKGLNKQGRNDWWEHRRELDDRLKTLLVNIENIWLGGFRGIFSQHSRNDRLFTKFCQAFTNILNRHLPSRRKTRGKKVTPIELDHQIMDLFIGLGNFVQEKMCIDDQLEDLLFFVLDVLQYHGEQNAYDEVDFDAMNVEVQDALRSYHCAETSSSASDSSCDGNRDARQHTILILDKRLHSFPWESLPSLQPNSISRLMSLSALRARLSTMSGPENYTPGHHISHDTAGTIILDPSGDLPETRKGLQPAAAALRGSWTQYVGVAPTESQFEVALANSGLMVYAGHGSSAQFVKARTVRRIAPTCSTALLFGCSSAALTEHGELEPSGMLAAYVAAGAPAVLGMLWDVTDRDCDRFAARVGERWGLWPEGRAAVAAKKEKGKETEKKAERERKENESLVEAVAGARDACYLRYLNGAASVVYGIPVYLA